MEWPRYKHVNNPDENEDVKTKFTPLKEEVIFKSTIRYHNLKKVELGALLSALTFHNNEKCFHNIGLAKPLGYGKIKVEITHKDIDNYLKKYELLMESEIESWAKQPQITELLTMATEQNNQTNSQLAYMKLEQFAKEKGQKGFLRKYTKLDNIVPNYLISLVTKEEVQSKKDEIAQLGLQQEWKTIQKADNSQQIEAFIKKCDHAELKEEAQTYLISLKEKIEKEKIEREQEKQRAEQEKLEKLKAEEEARKQEEEEKRKQRLEEGIDCSTSKDVKDLERAIKGFERDEKNISKLKECIQNIYPTLNKKKKGQLTRSKEMKKWVSEEFLNSLGEE